MFKLFCKGHILFQNCSIDYFILALGNPCYCKVQLLLKLQAWMNFASMSMEDGKREDFGSHSLNYVELSLCTGLWAFFWRRNSFPLLQKIENTGRLVKFSTTKEPFLNIAAISLQFGVLQACCHNTKYDPRIQQENWFTLQRKVIL